MNDYEDARDDETVGVELIRPASTFGSLASSAGVSTSSQNCDDAKVLSRATTQATLAAKTILAAGGSEDTALRTAKAAAQATLLESHIGIAAFSNQKGGPSAFMMRRKIKHQSEIVASMALMSATNQVYNRTDWDLLCGKETPSFQAVNGGPIGSSKSVKFARRPPRPRAPRKKSLTAIIKRQEVTHANSESSKASKLSIDSGKTKTNLSPSVPEPPKLKSGSIESDPDLGLTEKALSRSPVTVIVSQDSGKESVTVVSHLSESDQSSTFANHPHLSIVKPPSVASPKSMPVKINVVQSPGTNENRHDGTEDEPIYYAKSGATEEGRKDRYDMSWGASSTVVSEADDHSDSDETHSLTSKDSFMENHVDPCFSFWCCGAGEETQVEINVETPKAPAVPKKRLPSSTIESPRITLTDYSTDAETEVTANTVNQDDLDSPYEVALNNKEKNFRAELTATAKKREEVPLAEQEMAQTAEPGVQDEVEYEKQGWENDYDDSSHSPSLDARDISFESQASSLPKNNTKGKLSWKRLLGMNQKKSGALMEMRATVKE
jgi:hypothetical protein